MLPPLVAREIVFKKREGCRHPKEWMTLPKRLSTWWKDQASTRHLRVPATLQWGPAERSYTLDGSVRKQAFMFEHVAVPSAKESGQHCQESESGLLKAEMDGS